MNSVLSSAFLVIFLAFNANAIFHVRSNGQLIFFYDKIEAMSYSDGEKFCKLHGGQYPKLESKEDVDELSALVMKHKKKVSGYWIPLEEDDQGRFTWADGTPFDTSLAERVIETELECKGPKCHFLFDANRKLIIGEKKFSNRFGKTNVMCVISDFTVSPGDLEKSRKEVESLETEITALDTNVEMHALKVEQHVSRLLDIQKSTLQSLKGIRETVKKLRSQLSAA